MGSTPERREAIRKFKERKPLRGAFAVRCRATGHVWVGSFPDLYAMKNRHWFALRQGGHRDQQLQQEWDLHGEEAFEYEILEKLDDDVCLMAVSDLLKEKKLDWAAKLGARMI